MNVRDVMRERITDNPEETDGQVATWLLDHLVGSISDHLDAKAARLVRRTVEDLHPILVVESLTLRRDIMRARERVLVPIDGEPEPVAEPVRRRTPAFRPAKPEVQEPDRLRELRATSFVLPDGRRVTWADATVADHLARIAYLQKQADGLATTIARHEETIAQLKAAGVDTLAALVAKEAA